MSAVSTRGTVSGLRSLMAARYLSCSHIRFECTPSQTPSNEFQAHKNKSTRRYLQTNHLHRPLDNAGPERWSFKFKTNSGPSVATKQPRDNRIRNGATELKAGPAKWATYSMPSKETLLKQQEQTDQQNKEVAEKIASQDDSPRTEQTKKFKRKLRPRKALISLTPNAILHLKLLLNQPEPKLIRIGVKNRGCSGLTYDLEFTSSPGKFDEVVEQDGVKVIIDSKAIFSIVGSEMDWIDDRLSSRFVFKNPNSKGTCGCGESFMV
ncbi:LAME_0H16600g1_1 [Lachancea meyersii CBS 8951]|uniref:Iron-sulfur assembly protein 1 n=1 Tax=Lachancea meyersii CBS 8951 TaxID=1266667 RepID=A0A1G4KIF4_9SACH|nr:LAME_0H16600g1_1 [Lachancea meyersii CBS 8951]